MQKIIVFNLEHRYNSENTKNELKDFLIKAKDYKNLKEMEENIKKAIFDVSKCEINKTKY